MTKCALAGCNKEARRKFCSDKHKDQYHNLKNPRGYFDHLSGINDDSAEDAIMWSEHDSNIEIENDLEDDFHPFDSYSLGQWED